MLRIAFIGAGGRARNHLDIIAEADGATVVAICDLEEETAREAAAPHDAAVYTDHVEMFESESRLDAVFVVLPPFAHDDQELMAIERGIDLFVEKPLALSIDTAREIVRAVADRGVVAAAGYQLRYADVTQRALELVEGRDLALIEGFYKSGVPPISWWGARERSGGQVVEQATHVYDLVRLFGGEVNRVAAVGAHQVIEEIDFEDAVSANLSFESGAIGNVTSTSAASGFNSGLEIVGEGLWLTLSGTSLSGTVDGEEVEYEGERDPTRAAVEAFLEAVRTGDSTPIRSDYSDALRSLALTFAVEESLETGEPAEPRA